MNHPAPVAPDSIDEHVERCESRNRAKRGQHLRAAAFVEKVELRVGCRADSERARPGISSFGVGGLLYVDGSSYVFSAQVPSDLIAAIRHHAPC